MGRLVDGVKWGLDPDELFIDRAHLKFMGLGLFLVKIAMNFVATRADTVWASG